MDLPLDPVTLYEYETLARAAGYQKVIGIDEAGRGPLAGPVVVAAVALPAGKELEALNDSKQLSEKTRKTLFPLITEDPDIHWSVAVIDAEIIDQLNILRATIKGMRDCAAAIADADLAFIDGNPVDGMHCPAINVVKGDAKCACIAAASIIAKVHRDRLMAQYDAEYPGYDFADHKGYGTRSHLRALRHNGPCPLHRRSFAPVGEIIRDSRQLDLGL